MKRLIEPQRRYLDAVWIVGARAYSVGQRKADNPFMAGSSEEKEWLLGWLYGHREYVKERRPA